MKRKKDAPKSEGRGSSRKRNSIKLNETPPMKTREHAMVTRINESKKN